MGDKVEKKDELRAALVQKLGGGPRGEDAANVFEAIIAREVQSALTALGVFEVSAVEMAKTIKPAKKKTATEAK